MRDQTLLLCSLVSLFAASSAACAAQTSAHAARPEPPKRGFVVMIAEHDAATIGKSPPSIEAPILAVSSTDPASAAEQSLGTNDGHYSIKASWRPNGVDATKTPCLDVHVARRAKHPLPDADMRGCVVPTDGESWLGEIASEHGKALRAAVVFLPPVTAAPQDSSSAR